MMGRTNPAGLPQISRRPFPHIHSNASYLKRRFAFEPEGFRSRSERRGCNWTCLVHSQGKHGSYDTQQLYESSLTGCRQASPTGIHSDIDLTAALSLTKQKRVLLIPLKLQPWTDFAPSAAGCNCSFGA